MTTHKNSAPHRRKLRNFLLDVGLQLRYTSAIVIVAALLTGGLGYGMYVKASETSRVIALTGMMEPTVAQTLQDQFAQSDRVVLWGTIGFGVVLILSIGAVGIVVTHKVAGPLHKIAGVMMRVRDGSLAPPVRDLRKGDELQDFNTVWKATHDALRARTWDEIKVLGDAITALEDAGSGKLPAVDELRALRKKKEEAMLEG